MPVDTGGAGVGTDGIDAVLLQAEKSAWALEKANYEREKDRLSSELDAMRRQLASADRRLEAYQSDAAVDGPSLCPFPRSKRFALALEAGAISGHCNSTKHDSCRPQPQNIHARERERDSVQST